MNLCRILIAVSALTALLLTGCQTASPDNAPRPASLSADELRDVVLEDEAVVAIQEHLASQGFEVSLKDSSVRLWQVPGRPDLDSGAYELVDAVEREGTNVRLSALIRGDGSKVTAFALQQKDETVQMIWFDGAQSKVGSREDYRAWLGSLPKDEQAVADARAAQRGANNTPIARVSFGESEGEKACGAYPWAHPEAGGCCKCKSEIEACLKLKERDPGAAYTAMGNAIALEQSEECKALADWTGGQLLFAFWMWPTVVTCWHDNDQFKGLDAPQIFREWQNGTFQTFGNGSSGREALCQGFTSCPMMPECQDVETPTRKCSGSKEKDELAGTVTYTFTTTEGGKCAVPRGKTNACKDDAECHMACTNETFTWDIADDPNYITWYCPYE